MPRPCSSSRSLDALSDPLYVGLPAFAGNKVYELPATSYRPDYDGVMATLDQVQEMFTE